MLFYEGLSCPVCKRAFYKDEDIVACPRCGLPHHRACWAQIGHCYMEDKHGTEEQWSRESTKQKAGEKEPVRETASDAPFSGKICPHCRTRNAEYAEYCTHCGNGLPTADWQGAQPPVGEYTPFRSNATPTDSFSSAEMLGEATARDLAAVVGPNVPYYISRFRQICHTGGGGWNWAAFLFGPYWLLYRKQYLPGILLIAIQTVYDLFSNLLMQPMMNAMLQATTDSELQAAMSKVMNNRYFLPLLALSVILFMIHILLGIRGNNLYKRHCERKIRLAREETPDLSPAELTAVGGTSLTAAMVCYFVIYALSYVTTLLMSM